jgi:hypothetical protein
MSLDRIRDLVGRGYVVRTRADADTREARADDPTRRRLALASGAQWVSTDYPAPGIAARFGSRYRVRARRGSRPALLVLVAECFGATHDHLRSCARGRIAEGTMTSCRQPARAGARILWPPRPV